MLEHMGMRWGYVFLRTASHVDREEANELMLQAVENSLLTSLARGCLLTHGGEVEGKLGNFQAIEVERG